MNTRRFKYDSQEWEAEFEGRGSGAGASAGGYYSSKPMRWAYVFHCLTDKNQPEVHGHLSNSDANALPEEELQRELKAVLAKNRKKN